MTSFWIGAVALALAAAAFLAFGLWRDRRRTGRWSPTGLAAAVVVVPAAALVYAYVTTYSAPELPAGVTQEQVDMVERLAERMQQNPEDVRGWRLLGRSYMTLGRYMRARRAFSEAWQRADVKDNALKLGMAESMIYTDRSTLGGEAGRLIEEVLRDEPGNRQALWYGGFVALQRGRNDVAASRWRALLETDPPPELAAELRSRIASLTGSAPPAAPAAGSQRAAAAGSSQGAGAADGARRAAAADGPVIELDVRLGESISLDGLGPQAALFIFARAPGGGPPIAVIREPVDAVPGTFTLSDANTMLQGRSLADYEELTLVARISASGQPTEQAGDYVARTTYGGDDDGPVRLVIDEVVR